MDFQSLSDFIQATHQIRDLFLKYPETILQDIIGQNPKQIQNHIMTALTLNDAPNSDFNDVGDFVAYSLDTNETRQIVFPTDDPIVILDELRITQHEIDQVIHLYATTAYQNACAINNPGAVLKPFVLSASERLRIARAFWTLGLYSHQFLGKHHLERHSNNTEQQKRMIIDNSRPYFFRSSLSEFDELLCAHTFMQMRHRTICTSEPLQGRHRCLTAEEQARPSSWSYMCGGDHCFYWPRRLMGRPLVAPRCITTIPFFLRTFSIPGPGVWAPTQHFKRQPAREWPDWIDGNVPGPGWAYFDAVRSQHHLPTIAIPHFFQDAGIFFWDLARLVDWGFVGRWDGPNGMESYLIELDRQNQSRRSSRQNFVSLERRFEEALVRWTKSAVACTFEEWCVQGTMLEIYSRPASATNTVPATKVLNAKIQRS
jgi:hypothetical protein